jgi:hypothetical protein
MQLPKACAQHWLWWLRATREQGEELRRAFIGKKPKDFRSKIPQYNQRGGALNRGQGCSRGPYIMKPPYCIYHGNETNHHTKDCPIYLETKKKMVQDSAQLSHPPVPREVNHTMQWAPHHRWYSPSYPPHFSAQAYQNSQTQPPAYYHTTMPQLITLNLHQCNTLCYGSPNSSLITIISGLVMHSSLS